MGLLDEIKKGAQQSASNKGMIFYVKSGEKKRVRMLTDVEDGITVRIWNNYSKGEDILVTEENEDEYEGVEGWKLKVLYGFSVYDVDNDKRLLMLYGSNNYTPLPQLVGNHEENDCWDDRDYIIKCEGTKLNKKYIVVAQSPSKKSKKLKEFTEDEMWEIVKNAYSDSSEEDDEEEAPKRSKPKGNKKSDKKSSKKGSKKPSKVAKDEEDDEEWEDDEEDDEEVDYSEMTAKELYALCKERDIEALPRKKADYYIDLLEEW